MSALTLENYNPEEARAAMENFTREEREDILMNWQIEQIEEAMALERQSKYYTFKYQFLGKALDIKRRLIDTWSKLDSEFKDRYEFLAWRREAAKIGRDTRMLIDEE